MTHEEMNELYELYVLGTLEPDQAAEINQHVVDACEYCMQHIQEATLLASALAGLAEPQTPPARLRQRVIATVKPPAKARGWLFAVGGLSAACAALLALAVWTSNSVQTYRGQIASLQTERDQLREAVQILSKSETRTVQFGLADNRPHGRIFVNRNNGVVFVGSQLPELASNRTFQLWLIPTTGAPESAGLFRPNASGDVVRVRQVPVDTSRIHAVAVSVEPQGGSPAPTTTPILVVPLG